MKRIVVITGVAGGIGRATARLFEQEDWVVIGIDQRDPGTSAGVEYFIKADISEVKSSNQAFSEITKKVKRLDALVNNAAIQICKPLVETTPDEWDAIMACNLRSVYLAVRHAYPLMKQDGGAIVNISSVHAIATSINIAAYAASKGALLALTRALALEMSPENIRVNAILPGAVDTPMLEVGLQRVQFNGVTIKELKKQLGKKTVLGRVARPDEIAQAILFLADSERSSFITGQTLIVDGGASAKLSTE